MTLTGRQIREARSKLGWGSAQLAKRAGLLVSIVKRAEARDGEAVVTTAQIAALRLTFIKAGIEFAQEPLGEESDLPTGREIREARALPGLHRSDLAYKVQRITTLAIIQAEKAGDEPTLSDEQAALVRQTLERLGIDFTPEGPKLRKGET